MITDKTMPANQDSLAREQKLVHLLMTFLSTGLFFMVLPGTFLGVWNLFSISAAQSQESAQATWIQAHGHAQIFGWIGCFILGIGFYAIPNLRRVAVWSYWEGWLIWSLWSTGVGLRWIANVYLWQWRMLLPLSAVLEIAAVVIFLICSMRGHQLKGSAKRRPEIWAIFVIAGTLGLLAATFANAHESFMQTIKGATPAIPNHYNSILLTLSIWAFPVPIAWGFTAHWMPVLLGLRPSKEKLMVIALAALIAGNIAALFQAMAASSFILLTSAILMIVALRIFEKPDKPAKVQGVHRSFPTFMRIAYIWLLIAALLLVWAALEPGSTGIGGAGRHGITVGFLMTMVFTVAPRMIPAFLARKKLFSQKLMLLALLSTNMGCVMRVCSEIIAYQHSASWAWLILPLSATLELLGVVLFTINMIGTFRQPHLLDSGSAKAGMPGCRNPSVKQYDRRAD
ncbi:MAG: NnrS family protein [Candidatus Melainabacteria bacterium]|nr:NnrS family protein [Candidatus Melainabacteria bacterium]